MSSAVEEARKHIEAQIENVDTPIGQVGTICLHWLDYSPAAAELLTMEGKTLEGALNAMRDYASKHKNGNCAVVAPMQAMAQILQYYGQEDPEGMVEGGFAYHCQLKELEKVKPANMQPNPQPVSDLQEVQEKPKKAVTINLEDLL